MMDNRPAAAQLIELARKHLDQFTLWGAVFYVYNSAQERQLPWATPETLKLAEDALDQAIRSWLGDRLDALSRFRTGRALLEEAARVGRDPLRDALMYIGAIVQ
jgi:hypothetical protein